MVKTLEVCGRPLSRLPSPPMERLRGRRRRRVYRGRGYVQVLFCGRTSVFHFPPFNFIVLLSILGAGFIDNKSAFRACVPLAKTAQTPRAHRLSHSRSGYGAAAASRRQAQQGNMFCNVGTQSPAHQMRVGYLVTINFYKGSKLSRTNQAGSEKLGCSEGPGACGVRVQLGRSQQPPVW